MFEGSIFINYLKKEKKFVLSRGNNFAPLQKGLRSLCGESSASILELLEHWVWGLRGPEDDTEGRKTDGKTEARP